MKESEPPMHHHPVKENPFWLRFEARTQKYGALALLLIVIAALGGLFSEGYLSDKTAHNHNGHLTVDHQRFGRRQRDHRGCLRQSIKEIVGLDPEQEPAWHQKPFRPAGQGVHVLPIP